MGAKDRATIDAAAQAVVTAPAPAGSAVPAVPGLWVGVWDPKKGFSVAAYGDAKAGVTAATTDDSFRIGSITKPFTATVILSLVADGKISLDGTIKQYLPALAAKHPEIANVTVDQLLRMQSGIPDYANVPTNGVIPQVTKNPTKVWTTDELIDIGVNAGVTPGQPGYSTTNYLILGEIAQAVTGTPIEQLITDRVTKPLGLAKTVLPAPASTAAPQPQSRGYVTDAQEIVSSGGTVPLGTDVTDWNSWGQAGGGMWSTLQELATFAASDSGNSLLPKKLATNRLKTKDIGNNTRYGQGIIQFGPWVGHEGEALGYETWALRNTKTGVVYVASINSCCGTQALAAVAPLIALYPKDGKYFL
jgi:D-alanyl-D-alanine carboxypeptidase